jgi:ubiquinone/menaquinone biosynthesis C-methylase UbiE
MQPEEYRRMAEVQDRHWWFEAKRRTVGALLQRHRVGGGRVLEVGPGTGSMVDVMTRYGRMYAADAYVPALRLLRENRPAAGEVAPVGAGLPDLPFADASFALIGCFDVLYHRNVVSVDAAIRELHRVCAPGGYLTITDSAFAILRSSHDVATQAARRFRLRDLTDPLRAAGFTIEHTTYFHALLFPAALAVRLGKRALHGSPKLDGAGGGGAGRDGGGSGGDEREVAAHSDTAPVAPWLNRLLLGLYRVEVPLTTRVRVPFGSSLLILARRRG